MQQNQTLVIALENGIGITVLEVELLMQETADAFKPLAKLCPRQMFQNLEGQVWVESEAQSKRHLQCQWHQE